MSENQSNAMFEEWRDIIPDVIGAPISAGYQVSSCGRLRSRRKRLGVLGAEWKYIAGCVDLLGYTKCRFMLSDGRPYQTHVHRLVALFFIGPIPFDGAQVCHGDGDPSNNVVGNLRWGTVRDNAADKELHGRTPKGESVGTSSLEIAQVREIVRLCSNGSTQQEVADLFGVTQANVSHIMLGRSWSFLTGIVAQSANPNHVVLNKQKVCEIVQLRRDGVSVRLLAKQFGVSISAVKAILSGRAWSSVTGILMKQRNT